MKTTLSIPVFYDHKSTDIEVHISYELGKATIVANIKGKDVEFKKDTNSKYVNVENANLEDEYMLALGRQLDRMFD